MNDDEALAPVLAEVQGTIERQQQEIEHLRRQLADERLAEQLRQALILGATAGRIAAPTTHSRLLEMVVKTAAHVISAEAASLFLLDEERQELVFEVALGQKAEEVKKFRVPLGHGIAGLVAVSGQPMAISDVQRDARHASEISEAVGYAPQSILCVPLFYDERLIGVLELLDKQGAPSFTSADMEILGFFAGLAAIAIDQSRVFGNLARLMDETLYALTGSMGGDRQTLQEQVRSFAARVEEDATYRNTLELARLVHEIAAHGSAETAACRTILQGFAEYLRSRPEALR
jgi:GAF domain-containing protein